jgi:hypothetical protein
MALPDPFNSVGGYTVGIPPLPVIAANGDISTRNIIVDNINVTSNLIAGGNVYADTFHGTFAGQISGGLTVPGYTTQIVFNTDGNADASANFTFNKVLNILTVNDGSVRANSFTLGTGVNQFSTTQTFHMITNSTTPDQILTTIMGNTVCSMDYTIIATDPVANNRQTSKLMATILNGEVGYYEYGTIDVPQSSPGVADFKVGYTNGNVNLTVTPYTTNVNYRIMVTSYKE